MNNSKKRRRRLLPAVILVAVTALAVGGGLAVWGGGGPAPVAQPETAVVRVEPVVRPEPAAQVKPVAPKPSAGQAVLAEPVAQAEKLADGCNLLIVCPPQDGRVHFNTRAAWDGEYVYHDLGGPAGERVVYFPAAGGRGWWLTIPDVTSGVAVVAKIPTPAKPDSVSFLAGPHEYWQMNIKQLSVVRVEPPVCLDRVRVSGGDVIRAVFVDAVFVDAVHAPGGTVGPGGGSPVSELI